MTLSLLPITIVPIKTFQNSLKISHSLINYWKINTTKSLIIAVGGNRVEVTVEGAAITKDEIHLDENLFYEFLIPLQERQLIASYSNKVNSLFLGPIIGLLTEISDSTEEEPYFPSIQDFCKEMDNQVSEIGGFFFVFQLQDYTEGKISGYYIQNEIWQKSTVPLPDVIYNRIHSRKIEASPIFQKFKESTIAHNIPLFNDQFLSKEKVYELLNSEEYMQPYLPETVSVTKDTLENMISKYDSLFIKPIHGSQGRNIIKISKENNHFISEISTGKGLDKNSLFLDFDQLFKWIKPFLKKRSYLAQQGINLMKYKNKQLDFRILCHRNYQNAWEATSSVARISADEQFVSNIARGGEVMRPLQILSQLSNRKTAIQQLALIKELAIEVSSIISQNTDGIIGELGIDIGVDENGMLWIIEANVKPSKNLDVYDKKVRPSAKALIEYMTFLSFSRRYE
ncbi:YheC/YheD family endospore coat-associated protein [Cytobacillus dafuensis]|uniref:YheC/YheD family endospore coat-associated protein n=1 Tax=Cytobacillus dafuensis TaxID=1742359 RepID=UPI000ABF68CE|nr:YheC/YheD family protein [Cytobacillus dafuensis]